MQLVRSRPIIGPVERGGVWCDDFKASGGSHQGYFGYSAATRVRTPDGIGLESPANATSVSFTLPAAHSRSYTDFEAEWIWRGYGSPSVSTELLMQFRYGNSTHRLYVVKRGDNTLRIVKALSGVFTTLATVSSLPFTSWHRTGLRVIGTSIELFVDGQWVVAITETSLLQMGGVYMLAVYDPMNGVAKGEWQYIVIRPLGGVRPVLYHSFSGASLTPSDIGPNLTLLGGTVTISDGTIKPNGVANIRVGALIGMTNGVVQTKFRFNAASVSSDRRAILNIRSDSIAGGAPSKAIEAILTRSGNAVILAQRDPGVYTELASAGVSGGVLDSTDYWLRISFFGPDIRVWLSTDGVTFTHKITVNNNNYLTQGGVDLRIQDSGSDGNGSNGTEADNLLAWTA